MRQAVDPSAIGRGLARRLAEIEAAIDRYGAFAFRPGEQPPPPALGEGEALDAARELVLRALRAASDPVNDRLLRRLAEGDATLSELSPVTRLPRLAVWERVNDLVQAGLVGRSLEGDAAGLTGAGRALLELVDAVAAAATKGRGR